MSLAQRIARIPPLPVLRFEFGKALRAKLTYVVVLAPAALAALTVFWTDFARRAQTMLAGEGEAETVSAYVGFARGCERGLALGGILLLFHASMIVANEGAWKTFKTIMIRPHRRWEWIFGKFALLIVVAFATAFATALASYAASAAGGDFGDIAEEGYVYFEAKFMAEQTRLAFGLLLPPLLAVSAFGLAISTLTDHGGIAASGAMGGYVALEAVKDSMPDGRYWLFNTYLPSLLDTSYFVALKGYAEGMSDTGWEDRIYEFNLWVPLGTTALLLGFATLVFSRRNFLL